MKRVSSFTSLIIILPLSLAFILQSGCRSFSARPESVNLYIYGNHKKLAELDSKSFLHQKPVLVLQKGAVRSIKIIQRREDNFSIELQLSHDVGKQIENLTSANIGKRLVFMSKNEILMAPRILEAIKTGKIVVELPSTKKDDAERIARHFGRSIEFLSSRQNGERELDSNLKIAYAFREKRDCGGAVKATKRFLETSPSIHAKIAIYNEIALCYKLVSNKDGAAEAYRGLLDEAESVDLDNYLIITQANFYLSRFEQERKDTGKSRLYLDKAMQTLEAIIKQFPTTTSAEWANLTLASYELYRGNVEAARKRGVIAKQGEFKAQGYLLLGLCYEFEKKFAEAREEYKALIRDLPEAKESKIAENMIKNLDINKTNVEDFLSALNVG